MYRQAIKSKNEISQKHHPVAPAKRSKSKKKHSITSYMGNGQVNDDLRGHLTKTAIDPEELEPISVSMSLSLSLCVCV